MRLWFWWWAVWWAVWAAVGAESLFPTSTLCDEPTGTRPYIITCNLTGKAQSERDVTMKATNDFDQYREWIAIGALSLKFDFKDCESRGTTVISIKKSKNILLQRAESNSCDIIVRITDSEATGISFPAQEIGILENSIVEKIEMATLKTMKLEDSEVGEISITATEGRTIITGTKIQNIKRMEMKGNYNLEMKGSNISTMQGFHYDSSSELSKMTDVDVTRVSGRGFVISGRGKISIERVTFETLDSEAILIKDGASVKIMHSHIKHAVSDSWIVENGTTEFVNVSVGSSPFQSFSFMGTTLKPLALVVDCPSSPLVLWVSIVVGLALVAGILLGGVMVYFCLYKKTGLFKRNQPDGEGRVLLFSNNEVTTQNSSSSKPPLPTATSGNGPLHALQNGSLEEGEDLYDETETLQSPGSFPGDRQFAPPQPPRTPVHQPNNQDVDEENYEEVIPVSARPPLPLPHSPEKPTDSAPALPINSPPPIPQSSPAFAGFPSPPVGPPLATRNPSLPGDRGLLHDKGDIKSRPPVPIPSDPSKFSVQSSSSSVPDERDKLPPPPPPVRDDDDQDFYDDTSNILPSPPPKPSPSEKPPVQAPPPIQPVPPSNKSSFLRGNPPAKPDPLKKPTGSKFLASVKGRWPPSKPSLPNTHKPPPPPPPPAPTNDDDEDEAIYEDIP